MPEFNKDLAYQILAKIELIPEEWDQGDYIRPRHEIKSGFRTANICGTAKCFAGWACILTPGYKEVIEVDQDDPEYSYAYIAGPDGLSIDIHDTAERLLGLTEYQSGELFDGGNTMADLRRLIAEYAGVEVEEPAVHVITIGAVEGTPIEDRYRMGEDE